MKISQLPKINTVRRDIQIPLAVNGENRNITLGQILDSIPNAIVPFSMIRGVDPAVQYEDGSPTQDGTTVVFDTATGVFYLAVARGSDSAGIVMTTWTYFRNWAGASMYYDADGNVRKDCLFRASSGRLYFFDGEDLKSAGVTDEQAEQIRHADPIEVESEEEMANRIAMGEYEEGQLYFLAEGEE